MYDVEHVLTHIYFLTNIGILLQKQRRKSSTYWILKPSVDILNNMKKIKVDYKINNSPFNVLLIENYKK
jgi:hypothetical protein